MLLAILQAISVFIADRDSGIAGWKEEDDHTFLHIYTMGLWGLWGQGTAKMLIFVVNCANIDITFSENFVWRFLDHFRLPVEIFPWSRNFSPKFSEVWSQWWKTSKHSRKIFFSSSPLKQTFLDSLKEPWIPYKPSNEDELSNAWLDVIHFWPSTSWSPVRISRIACLALVPGIPRKPSTNISRCPFVIFAIKHNLCQLPSFRGTV